MFLDSEVEMCFFEGGVVIIIQQLSRKFFI